MLDFVLCISNEYENKEKLSNFFSIDLGLNISLKYNYTYNTMQKLQSVVRYGIQSITQLILL